MSEDKRSYERYEVTNRPVSIFLDGTEYTGQISNVSEAGIGIVIDESFAVSKPVSYQFYYSSKKSDGSKLFHLVSGYGSVARSNNNFLGCRLNPCEELSSYVRAVICNAAC